MKLVGMAVLFGLVSGSVFLGVNMVGNKLLGNGGSANPSIVNPESWRT